MIRLYATAAIEAMQEERGAAFVAYTQTPEDNEIARNLAILDGHGRAWETVVNQIAQRSISGGVNFATPVGSSAPVECCHCHRLTPAYRNVNVGRNLCFDRDCREHATEYQDNAARHPVKGTPTAAH